MKNILRISGDQVQSLFPVRASSAVTVLGGSVMYMMPSATSGVVSTRPSPPLGDGCIWYAQITFNASTLSVLISFKGE